MEHKHLPHRQSSDMNHWVHLANVLWHAENYGPWPGFGLVGLGIILMPVGIGLPIMILGAVKLYHVWWPKPPQ